ncbi:hypothetical protein ACMCNP_07875 [Candidatus Acidulodesulfobacterium sp. H_13]|uniref:hypothetical protein n=1 Tax=Candidatus Acidulodesulfobacterium sp. H_13 TaxID=3395470 RepID=UPI003AF9BF70
MKKTFIALQMSILIFLLSACAVMVVNSSNSKLIENSSYLVVPFKNYTQTPNAGYRIASILNGILRSKNYKIFNYPQLLENNGVNNKNIIKTLNRAKNKGIRYVISGDVNEFRYKTGIEGEPAVSITIFVYNSDSKKIIWSSTGSATGWSNQSITTVAQNLLNRLLHF